MEKLKMLLRTVMLLAMALSVQSCLDDDDDVEYGMVDWATVHYEDEIYSIESDECGPLLLRDSSLLVAQKANREGQRIVAAFNYDDGGRNNGSSQAPFIRLYQLEKALTKPAISFTEEMEDSIGNDPITINYMSLSDKHLNIKFSYRHSGGGVAHMLNLIIKEGAVLSPDGTLEVEFRHNNNDDVAYYNSSGYVSFELKSIPAYVEGRLKGLRVTWKPGVGEGRSYTVRFKEDAID